MSFVTDLKFAFRSLTHAKGLALTVIVTLALGIGANAAMFSVVRGVLLRPLVNRDESRLIYIRQSAPGIEAENTTFSVPELIDLRSRMKTVIAFGDFSTIGFTMVGLGEPRVVRAGVVGGSYFDVMGLRPVLGRLIDATDDGPNAAGVAVLTHRFWTTGLGSNPNVIGKTVRLGERSATIIGILEPSVPYPEETEIIANVVTSPHHLSATMVTGRTHRMTELFGRLAPGADLAAARAELRAVHGAILKEHPEAYQPKSDYRIDAKLLRDQLTSRAQTVLLLLLAASALIFVIACSNVANLILARSVRREGELAIRAALGAGTGRLRQTLLAESLLLCGSGARIRTVSPGFFASLGVPIIAGHDFNENHRPDGEKVVIVSKSVAQRMFPSIETAVNGRLMWTDPVMLKFGGVSGEPRRIVGVAADIDDENIVPGPAMTVYHPAGQFGYGSRLFVHTRTEDPYALAPSITRIIRQMSAEQPIGRAATLEDVRAEVLAPDRLNALVFGGFALVALTIAIVGVAGVLAFSVSARTREFGIRLAVGCEPRHLLARVLGEGAMIAAAGIIAGALGGLALTRFASALIGAVQMPGVLPIAGAAMLLVTAAILASLLPAARAARVDVVQALRSE